VIVGCVVLVVSVNFTRKQKPREADGPTAQQLMMFRYAIGADRALGTLAGTQPANSAGAQVARQMRSNASTDADRLYAGLLTCVVHAREQGLADVAAALDSSDANVRAAAEAFLAILDAPGPRVTDTARQALVDRHKWIGRYVVATVDPSRSDERSVLQAEAVRTFSVLAGFLAVVVVALLVGVALLVTGVVLLLTGKLRFAIAEGAGRDVALLEAFALYLGLMTAGLVWGASDLPGGRAVGLPLLVLAFALGIGWPFLGRREGTTTTDIRRALGLHRGRGVLIETLAGVAGYIALLPVMALGILITFTLTRISGADASHPIGDELTGPLAVFILLTSFAAVFAPVSEELMFRGAFFGHLRTRVHWVAAAGIIGVIFGAIHPQGWAGVPAIAMVGFNMAVLRQWRGSIIAPIVAHALNNGTIVLMVGLALR